MTQAAACPSCHATMQVQTLPASHGATVELDLCFACQGMWLDHGENLRIAPDGVVTLFRLLHEHQHSAHQPLAARIDCPRCSQSLTPGFDVVRSGRYMTYRCARRHGRFSTFSSFMIEKGFVRLLTRAEIDDIARRVAVIHCSCCGAPVDIRKDHACPYCKAAFSLLDPKAVEQALQGYAAAVRSQSGVKLPELADALVMLERDRLRAQRDSKAGAGTGLRPSEGDGVDLLTLGVGMVWAMLS